MGKTRFLPTVGRRNSPLVIYRLLLFAERYTNPIAERVSDTSLSTTIFFILLPAAARKSSAVCHRDATPRLWLFCLFFFLFESRDWGRSARRRSVDLSIRVLPRAGELQKHFFNVRRDAIIDQHNPEERGGVMIPPIQIDMLSRVGRHEFFNARL